MRNRRADEENYKSLYAMQHYEKMHFKIPTQDFMADGNMPHLEWPKKYDLFTMGSYWRAK